jgi:3-methylcrotonyl-CoA carboxylase alpha subunit
MFSSLLIANRGEIACRIVRTARRLGIRTIAVFTEADRTWPHWQLADEAVLIGAGPAAESYLNIEKIIDAAQRTGAEAVHPGYGFLAENAEFAKACIAAGLVFVGPPAKAIAAMGDKARAKALMIEAGVPVVPGYHGANQSQELLKSKARELGYPLLIKATAGGGGRGLRHVDQEQDFLTALASAQREAKTSFGDDRVLLEKFVANPRHIEIQIFADDHGNAVHLHERECSLQRRHQKVIEEAPAPGMPDAMGKEMGKAAVKAALAVGYRGAGTVEFIADGSAGLSSDKVYLMEMNTRLQVEHPVTEAITGLDLVEWQLRIAAGEKLPLGQDAIPCEGHGVEARIYAEDPGAGFAPATGRIISVKYPAGTGVRVDAGARDGSVISPHYDAMLGKVIAHGKDRAEAIHRLAQGLKKTRLAGPTTNLPFLRAILAHPDFIAGGVDTSFIDRHIETLTATSSDMTLAAPAIAVWLTRQAESGANPANGPWRRTNGFEIGGLTRQNGLDVLIDGIRVTARIDWRDGEPAIASIDGETVSPADTAAGANGAETVWSGDTAFVLSDAGQTLVDFPDPRDRAMVAVTATGAVAAPMHGRVIALAVHDGQKVAKGEVLFVVEVMKMEHAVTAPVDGVVSHIAIKEGAQVDEGAPAMVVGEDVRDSLAEQS